jgi:carbonic anhydrase/acetyltransferase-like protein (isoleucine patch superfamily)
MHPEFGTDCWFAENATIVGDVIMGDQCSVWFNAVVRGDVNSIRLGNKVNIQDGAVLHCTYQKTTVSIGNNVSIGHNALVHGCTIEDNVLVGMGSIVMDNCHIEANCIIAAGAVLLEGTRVESWSIYAGVPAKKVKTLSPELFQGEVQRIATNYVTYSSWFKEEK